MMTENGSMEFKVSDLNDVIFSVGYHQYSVLGMDQRFGVLEGRLQSSDDKIESITTEPKGVITSRISTAATALRDELLSVIGSTNNDTVHSLTDFIITSIASAKLELTAHVTSSVKDLALSSDASAAKYASNAQSTAIAQAKVDDSLLSMAVSQAVFVVQTGLSDQISGLRSHNNFSIPCRDLIKSLYVSILSALTSLLLHITNN